MSHVMQLAEYTFGAKAIILVTYGFYRQGKGLPLLQGNSWCKANASPCQ
jgi:hypothetical protein